jgi:hypothetical protein
MKNLINNKSIDNHRDSRRKLPDWCLCIICDKPNMWIDSSNVLFCSSCEKCFSENLNICPNNKCNSYKNRVISVTSSPDGNRMPITRMRCLACGKDYTSHTCLRIPYLFYFSVDRSDKQLLT